MESAFAWLNQLIETFYRFFPHILIVRATHGGVQMGPRQAHQAAHVPDSTGYWPLTTEVEVVVTARQTLAIPDQVMATKDGKKVVVKTLVVYKIRDPVRAIGKLNWDVDTTINDLTQSAVVRVIATHTYDEIMAGISGRKPDHHADQRGRRSCGSSASTSSAASWWTSPNARSSS